jgi:taurine dioxygenase
MEIRPHPGTGVEILGVDLRNLGEATFAEIRGLFDRHGLVFFRDQELDEREHIALAERFGTVNVNRFFDAHPDFPEIALVAKMADQRLNIGGIWHTDHSYDEEPALGSVLVARELPSRGGDTLFVSMYDALDLLPESLRDRLFRMKGVHSSRHVFGSRAEKIRDLFDPNVGLNNAQDADELERVVHPAVIRHPLSGREALYVNPGFTVGLEGWPRLLALPLLGLIYARVLAAGKVARFRWRPGSVAIWDNRATWHRAKNDYRGERRVMHRVTIDGTALSAARMT